MANILRVVRVLIYVPVFLVLAHFFVGPKNRGCQSRNKQRNYYTVYYHNFSFFSVAKMLNFVHSEKNPRP